MTSLYSESEIAAKFNRPVVPFLETRTNTVDGLRVRYADVGKGDAVLLIHGFPETLQGWRAVAADLGRDFRVLAPDMPGVGGSDRPDIDYKPQELALFLCKFLDSLGVKKAHVVGADTGLPVAVTLAGEHAEHVDRLVLAAGTIYSKDISSWEISLMTTRVLGELIVYNPFAGSVVKKALRKGFSNPDLASQEIYEEYAGSVLGTNGRRASLRMMRSLNREEAFLDACLKKIRGPVLVVYADKDCYFPPAAGAHLETAIGRTELKIIPNCGHFLQEEKPAEFTGIIRDFLKPQPAKGDKP